MPDTVLISLGSNQGASADLLQRANAALAVLGTDFRASPVYRTSPVDCAPGTPDFLNAAAAFTPHPALGPQALLPVLKALEAGIGGPRPAGRNLPRALDLDLVLWGDRELHSPLLSIPHPRAHLRRFVLAPAADVAPDLRWPGDGRRVAELLAALDGGDEVSLLT